jgi:putative salt-induced outer membrane protein YdiY
MRPFALLFAFAALAIPAVAAAELPKSTAKDESVSKGKTEVTSDAYQTAAKYDPEAKNATELAINGGGLLASGNSSLLAVTGGLNHRLRREANQFTLVAAANYSRSAVGDARPTATVENVQGRTRYDRFFTERVTGFLGVQARRDRFAGLDLRLQIDPGVGYYFVNFANRVSWFEVGYDYLYDVRREDARFQKDAAGKTDPTQPRLDKTQGVHSARVFVGHRHKLNDGVTIAGGIEFLQGISDGDTRRVNGDLIVSSKFTASFSLATSFLVRYDSKPLPGKQNLDTITSVNLVYSLL